eukprot:15329778-Ditylum_brightwellii.AAC.1
MKGYPYEGAKLLSSVAFQTYNAHFIITERSMKMKAVTENLLKNEGGPAAYTTVMFEKDYKGYYQLMST